MTAIFAGTTMQCLEHLKDAVQDEGYIEMRRNVAAFADVVEATVDRWLNHIVEPSGESLLRLRFYLEFLGYDVAELHELQESVREAGRIVAFGIVSLADLAKMVGYSEGRSGIDALLRVYRGISKVPEARLPEFVAFVELYREKFPEKQGATSKVQFANRRYPSLGLVRKVSTFVPPQQQVPEIREAILESFAEHVKAMFPLAKLINSDEFTAEQRAQVREMAGAMTMFLLATELYALGGERTRDMHR